MKRSGLLFLSILGVLLVVCAGCRGDGNKEAGPSVVVVTQPSVGTTIAAVQEANGKPFLIWGFEIDKPLAGSVYSWEGGRLEGSFVQFSWTSELPGEEFGQICGDGPLRSDNPLLTKAGMAVNRLTQLSMEEY